MNRLTRKGWLFFVAINWLLCAELHSAEVSVESLLADINRKPAAERLKALVEGAKKEGIVYHYGSINAPDNDELTKAFNKQYPFVEVRYTRLGAEQIVNRAVTEARSGVPSADVISMRGTFMPELSEKKIIARYKSPMTAFLRRGFTDSEGFMATTFATGYAMIFNVTRVKPGEAPKSYEDLLQPRWKGRLVLVQDTRPAQTGKRYLDKRIVPVEAGDNFLRVAQVGGRIKSNGPFLFGILDQEPLPLFRREAIGFFQNVFHCIGERQSRGGGADGGAKQNQTELPEPNSFHNVFS